MQAQSHYAMMAELEAQLNPKVVTSRCTLRFYVSRPLNPVAFARAHSDVPYLPIYVCLSPYIALRVIYWENPIISLTVMSSILLFCYLVSSGGFTVVTLVRYARMPLTTHAFLLPSAARSSPHRYTPLRSYLTLLQLIVSAVYVNVSRAWSRFRGEPLAEGPPLFQFAPAPGAAPAAGAGSSASAVASSAASRAFISQDSAAELVQPTADALNKVAAFIFDIFRCTNNWNSFMFGLVTLIIALVGARVTATAMLAIATVTVFTVPVTYRAYRRPIDSAAETLLRRVMRALNAVPFFGRAMTGPAPARLVASAAPVGKRAPSSFVGKAA
jgi:hypothetical protein